LDFTDFNDVKQPRKIKKGFDAIKAAAADPDTRVVILTARPKGAASAVKKYMAEEGLDNIETVALQSSDPMSKANWISDEVKKNGHEEASFMDDSPKNSDAVNSIPRPSPKTLNVTNPPLPTEEDYDGPESTKQHVSDTPTRAVSVVDKKKGIQPVPGQHSSEPKPAQPPKPAAPAAPAAQPQAQPSAQPQAQPGAQTQPKQQAPAQQAPAAPATENKPGKDDMSWWREQTPDFQKKYLEKYPESKFKAASVHEAIAFRIAISSIAERITGASRFRGAASMPTESNQKLKDYIFKNWKKTNNHKTIR
jgi:hypothetical protein